MSLQSLARLILLTFIGCIVFICTHKPATPVVIPAKTNTPVKLKPATSKPTMTQTNKLFAYNWGADCVKGLLKDPRSAEFVSSRQKLQDVTVVSSKIATVSSIVRARNGFGGMVVSTWTARVNVKTGDCTCSVK